MGHFTSGVIDALTSAVAAIANLTTTELVATNSTTTNLYVSGSARIGSGTGVVQATNGVVAAISNGSDGQVLKIVGAVPAWGADLTGSGGGSSAWATTTDSLAVYPSTTSNVILVGTNATSTTGNILEVKGNTLLRGNQTTQGIAAASTFTATSSAATSTFGGGLSVLNFTQTGSATSTGSSGWNIAAGCYAINNQCLSFSTLAGQISLTSQVTGTLPVASGGTGSTTLSGILKGNGTSQIATAVGGTDYEFPLTFNSPFSRAGNAISLSTSGDWSGTLTGFTAAQLIALGFSTTSADTWKSTRNFFATTSADYYLTQNQGASYSTTSANYWLTTKSTTNVAEGGNLYYTANRVAGVIAGTTTTALAEGSNLYFTNARADTRVAAAIAGTTTDALAEGSNNKYFTNARADARINATSTIGTLTSAPSLSTLATSLTGFLKATAGVLSTALIDLTSNITGILPVGNGGTGWASLASGAIPYGNGSAAVATTTAGTAGQVLALLNGVPTWTATTTLSTITGVLAAGGGGTGIGNPSAAGILLGSYAGGSWQQLATSSLGLLTTNVAEGSNLYFTNTRFDNRLSATTSLPNIITLANLASVGSITATSLNVLGTSQFANSSNFFGLTSFGATGTTTIATNGTISTPSIIATAATLTSATSTFLFASIASASSAAFGATATSTFSSSGVLSLAGGPNGPLDARNGVVSATTSIAALYGGTGQTSVTTGDLLYGSATNAWSKLGIGTGGYVLGIAGGLPAWIATTTLSTISGTLSGTQLDGVFGSNGILARTTTGTYASRTLTGTANQITVANGDGIAGNPILSFPSLLSFTQSSSTRQSIFDRLYVGDTATTTILGSATSTFGAGISASYLNVTGTGAMSTFARGIDLAGGCYSINGTCIGGGSGGVGSGTQGQFAFYNVAGTSLTATSTLFLAQNMSLGIGTTTPVGALSIYGDTLFAGTSRYANFGTTTGALGYGFRDNAGTLEFKNQNGTWQGVTTATSGPSFSVNKNNSDQTVSTAAATKLTWSTEAFDTNNNFANDKFTPTVPGKYVFYLNVFCTNSTDNCGALIYKNGS